MITGEVEASKKEAFSVIAQKVGAKPIDEQLRPAVAFCNAYKKCCGERRRTASYPRLIEQLPFSDGGNVVVKIRFWGAAGTVTGSKYFVEADGQQGKKIRLLIDAGIFQGERLWRERNWDDPETKLLKEVDACLITHAHVDHTGMLPRFCRLGLSCPVYATLPTKDLCEILLPDSASLQEEDAKFRERRGKSRHNPPMPLYKGEDAEAALKLFRGVAFNTKVKILEGVIAEWRHMGHILGAASLSLDIYGKRICFSGDVGRYGVPILKDPQPMDLGDLLLIESTYGDRLHSVTDPGVELEQIINRTVKKKGVVVIPSFAVGRCQSLLYYLRELKESRRIPDIPVIVDSPTSDDATAIYAKHPADYDEEALEIMKSGRKPFSFSKLYFTKDKEESIKLNSIFDPMIIISASGMLSGGRILHHLRHRISDERNTVVFVGHQPDGGRGAWIQSGAKAVRIFNEEVPIRAEIAEIGALSAHADKNELIRWCKTCGGKPGKVAVVHGEPASAESFKQALENELGWNSFVASYQQEVEL